MLFVIMEYLTRDGQFTKLYGYHFMLANHFRHGIRINFPFYFRQSLCFSIQAIQNYLNGEHVCHEELVVLIMNVLKSKMVEKPRGSLKGVEHEIKGSISEKGYDKDTKDEVEGRNRSLKGGIEHNSQKKKRKVEVSDSDYGSDLGEENRRGS